MKQVKRVLMYVIYWLDGFFSNTKIISFKEAMKNMKRNDDET